MKLIIALKKVFQREGQTLMELNNEVKALTDADRADFVTMFNKMSLEDAAKFGIIQPVEA